MHHSPPLTLTPLLIDQISRISEAVERWTAVVLTKWQTQFPFLPVETVVHDPQAAYLKPDLEAGLLSMTQPDSPNSPTQRYRLTESGRRAISSP